ncbi:MAG TPA: cytochrome C [Planctomycetes bacterium]|nr:cytochrome C [Planctomycetota bacterium]
MAQIFHPSFNTISKVSIFGAVFFLGAAVFGWDQLLRSPYTTGVHVAREQPVPFSHKHHVAGLGIDCRFCHTSVEESAFAGIPPTKTCMGCHSLVWKDTPMLEPVRESYRTDEPIAWTRVHDLPDFVYFDHSIHVKKGMGCTTCHGQVDEMPLMERENTLNMDWCLSCHRHPEKNVRPREAVFRTDWDPASLTTQERADLVEQYEIESLTNCATCHR